MTLTVPIEGRDGKAHEKIILLDPSVGGLRQVLRDLQDIARTDDVEVEAVLVFVRVKSPAKVGGLKNKLKTGGYIKAVRLLLPDLL